jgi:DNA-binding CsgD family transcriptional regulator
MAMEDLMPYGEYYRSVNILSERCDAIFPTGTVRFSHLAVPNAEFEKSEFCNDYFLPLGMYYSFGIKVPINDQTSAYLACMRPKHLKPFDEREGMVLRSLLPHLQRAMRIHQQSRRAKSQAGDLKSVLDTLDRGIFGLDRKGTVILSNRRAEIIAERKDGLKLQNGHLLATSTRENTDLQSRIAQAITPSIACHAIESKSLHLSRSFEDSPLQITISPFPLRSNGSQLADLVFVSDPAQTPEPCSSVLRQLYGLSPTESRLTDLLQQGLEVREAALRLGTTLETARFHLKRVLAKAGSRRQTELMRLMLSLPVVPGGIASVM